MRDGTASEFRDIYRQRQRRRVLGTVQDLALGAAVISLFAWVTSLDILRHAALIAVSLPLIPLFLGLRWRRSHPAFRAPLLRGATAMAIAGLAVGLAWTHPGLGLGYERKLSELPPPRVRQAEIEARRHPSQDTILRIVEQAREQPEIATLRPLIPFLQDNHLLLTTTDGRTRPANSVVREILLANPALFYRSLHEDALNMASLLPLEGPVPPAVEVDVAGRLRESLGLLIELHTERRMQGRFEVPSVGVTLPVVSEDPEHGARVVRHEVGITYPFAEIPARGNAELDFATVSALLDMVREDLGY